MRDRERKLYEKLLEEKDKQILILSDQIDHLRLQLGQQVLTAAQAKNPTDQPPVEMGVVPWMNEDEEEVRAMVKAGLITEAQVPDVLDALGANVREL